MAEFFNMGGYAAFVWSAWGVSLVVLAALFAFSWARYRRALKAAGEDKTK